MIQVASELSNSILLSNESHTHCFYCLLVHFVLAVLWMATEVCSIACYIKVTSLNAKRRLRVKAFPLAFAWVEKRKREKERERERVVLQILFPLRQMDVCQSLYSLTHSLVILVASGMDEDAVYGCCMRWQRERKKERKDWLKVGWEER